jgi:hypothetical protein
LNPQIFLLVLGQQLQAAAVMVLFKSVTFAAAGSLAVGKCQSAEKATDCQNAPDDDDVFLLPLFMLPFIVARRQSGALA